ncbi:hypothetical protein C0991_003754, partial [Blastosporella zonata]
SGGDSVDHRLLDLPLDEPRGERSEGLVQKIMLGVADAELKGIDFDVDRVDFEYGGAVFSRGDEDDGGLYIPTNQSDPYR